MADIRKEARALAAEYLGRLWDDSVPVDPVVIAQRLGVQVQQADLPENMAGAIWKRKGTDPVIIVEKKDHPHRQRFTVAHEIGHYARKVAAGVQEIDFMDRRDAMASQGTDVEEIFANEFAASLLMPEAVVRRLAEKWRDGSGKSNVLVMASAFRVSEDALRYRLPNLEIV